MIRSAVAIVADFPAILRWLAARPPRRASLGVCDLGFEVGLFCRVSFKPDGSGLQGEGWRYWRGPFDQVMRDVALWIRSQPAP